MANSLLNELAMTLSDRSRSLLGRPRAEPMSENLVALGEQLLSGRGEASGVALARLVLDTYVAALPGARLSFLKALAERFGIDPTKVELAIAAYRQSPTQ